MKSKYFREYFCSFASKSYYFYILGVSHHKLRSHFAEVPPYPGFLLVKQFLHICRQTAYLINLIFGGWTHCGTPSLDLTNFGSYTADFLWCGVGWWGVKQWQNTCKNDQKPLYQVMTKFWSRILYMNGLVQERRNSIADRLELHLSCTNPLIIHVWPMLNMLKLEQKRLPFCRQ